MRIEYLNDIPKISRPKSILQAARIQFLPASIIPFLIGAAYSGTLSEFIMKVLFFFGFISVATAHLSGNLLNDYFDYKSGADNIEDKLSPFFGGSRVIQNYILHDQDVLFLGLVFASLSFFSAIVIFVLTNDPVFLLFMLVTSTLTVEYTAMPFRFSYNKLGELVIFLLFGVLLVMGSSYLFTRKFTMGAFLLSLPVGFLVSAIIICNEIPDYLTDVEAGKFNLISFVGRRNGYFLYTMMIVLSFLTLIMNISSGNIPEISLLAIFFYPFGIKAALILKNEFNNSKKCILASMLTVLLHTAVGISLILTLLLIK